MTDLEYIVSKLSKEEFYARSPRRRANSRKPR